MKFSGISQRWSKLSIAYRTGGFSEIRQRLTEQMRVRLGQPSAERAAYLQQKQRVDKEFDNREGVDTGGIQKLFDLSIESENARYGTSHIASDPGEFAAAMTAVDIDLRGAAFIDLGSGKGRALVLASDYPFAKIIGIEFAAELFAAAEANFQRLRDAGKSDSRVSLIHGDATLLQYPAEPSVLYLYNPFDAPVIENVARRSMASWRAAPRPLRVAYVNPVHHQAWIDAGWRKIRHGNYFHIYAPE